MLKFEIILFLSLVCVKYSQGRHRPRGSEINFRESSEENQNADQMHFPPAHGRRNHPSKNIPMYFPGERNRDEHDDSEEKRKSKPKKDKKRHKSNKRLCERKYTEYIERIFPNDEDTAEDADDSEFDGRSLAEPGEYPHMTAIGFETFNHNYEFKCGGSLISENFVITAAHCTNLTGQEPSRVRIGDLNLKVEEKYLDPQIRQIKTIYKHPQYNRRSYYNDIALLELNQDVEFTEFVRPIRLWIYQNIPYQTAYGMGYGSTSFGKVRTNRLTDLNMTIVSNDECNAQLPSMPEAQFGIIDSQICAQDFELNRDTCQGDSGGPLQLNIYGRRRHHRKHYHLIGITSYGLFCRSANPSVYTRISSYLDWIESIVWKE